MRTCARIMIIVCSVLLSPIAAAAPDWFTTIVGRVLTDARSADSAWHRLKAHVDLVTPPQASAAEPAPLVLMVPGCLGWRPHDDRWRQVLLDAGFAVMHVDSFAARGLTDPKAIEAVVCEGEGVYGFERAGDMALALARHPIPAAVDRTRIALAGWSHGGWAAWSLMHFAVRNKIPPGLKEWPRPDPAQLRAVIAVYPYCGFGTHSWAPVRDATPPSLLVLAGRDENVESAPCRSRARTAQARGAVVEVVELPTATHWFDNDGDFDLMPHEFDPEATSDVERRILELLNRTLRE